MFISPSFNGKRAGWAFLAETGKYREIGMSDLNLPVRGVAHDLNNQIMILLNALDRVVVLCPEEADVLRAVKAAEQCAHLTARLLPHAPARRWAARVSARSLMNEVAASMRALLPNFHEISVECAGDFEMEIDSSELQQVLVNLCINAMDAMRGPGTIGLRAERSGGVALLSVADTGPGVPVAMRTRIFEPLFTTKRARGGNGLGLSRAKEIVERYGGRISVHDAHPEGAHPRGALFRITLPALT